MTLKAAEAEAAKSTKSDIVAHPEKTKRKYKKRLKENQGSQNSGVSLLKPASQQQNGTSSYKLL